MTRDQYYSLDSYKNHVAHYRYYCNMKLFKKARNIAPTMRSDLWKLYLNAFIVHNLFANESGISSVVFQKSVASDGCFGKGCFEAHSFNK